MRLKLPEDPAAIWIEEPPGAPRYSFILDELEPLVACGAYGVVEAARDLDAWIQVQDGDDTHERENRRRLASMRSEFATAVPELQPTLPSLLALLRAGPPGTLEIRAIGLEAQRIAAWAEALGATGTAITFAQLAQEADFATRAPDPRFAYELGRVALMSPGYAVRGVEWLEWAVREGRRLARWEVAADALTLLSRHAERQGDRHAAMNLRRRAGRARLRLAHGGADPAHRDDQ